MIGSTRDGVAIAIELLLADAGVVARVGDRIGTFEARQDGQYPDILLYPTSASADSTLAGASYPWRRNFSVQARGETYPIAWDTGEEVLRVLTNFAGIVADQNVLACYPVNDGMLGDDSSSVNRRVLDFRMYHSPVGG